MNPSSSSSIPLPVLQTPFCGELRSKKFYMRDTHPVSAEDFLDSFGHVWCYHTQLPIGPDGKVVHPTDCTPGRECYRSAVQEPEDYLIVQNRFQKTQNPEV
jgi:hypothetical protein